MLFGYVWLPYGCWLSCCLVLGKADLLLVRTLGLHRAIFEPTFPLLVVSFWRVACSWTSGDGSPPKILVMCQGLKVSRKIKRQTCSDFFSCQVVSVYWTRPAGKCFIKCSMFHDGMMRWHLILIPSVNWKPQPQSQVPLRCLIPFLPERRTCRVVLAIAAAAVRAGWIRRLSWSLLSCGQHHEGPEPWCAELQMQGRAPNCLCFLAVWKDRRRLDWILVFS